VPRNRIIQKLSGKFSPVVSILGLLRPIFTWDKSNIESHLKWTNDLYPVPAPQLVKWGVLERWGSRGTWVETGTYLGDTAHFLSTISNCVFTLEPSDHFFRLAQVRFMGNAKVRTFNGSSESALDAILNSFTTLNFLEVSFWLDGHYSAGETFRGSQDCPVIEELSIISKYMDQFGELVIFIDDFRCFSSAHSQYPTYPSAGSLVEWASHHGLQWTVEHDIFIVFKKTLNKFKNAIES